MTVRTPQEVTRLLHAWRDGNGSALDELMPLVYKELHRLAHHYMLGERRGHILQTSALVNDAYLQLIDARQVQWQDRAHFFAISANLMRQILVHFARSRDSQKRGGQYRQVSLEESAVMAPNGAADLLDLDDALTALAEVDPKKAKVVELRFFGELSLEETAEVLKSSVNIVWRDWNMAKSWLYREMRHGAK